LRAVSESNAIRAAKTMRGGYPSNGKEKKERSEKRRGAFCGVGA
jgi:hypothetical protein